MARRNTKRENEGTKMSTIQTVLEKPFSIIGQSAILDSDFQKVHIKEGVDVLTPRKVYELEVKSGEREHITISDADMILSVDKIRAAKHGQALLQRVICRELYHLSQKSETIKNMGFSSVEDFANRMFAMSNKAKTVSQYIRIGKWFINDDYSVKDYLPSTIGVSAMLELLAPASDDKGNVSEETVAKWFLEGILVDGMTIRRIREVLKMLSLPPANNSGKDESSDNSGKDESSDNSGKDNSSDNSGKDNSSDNVSGQTVDTLNEWTREKAGNTILSYVDAINTIVAKFVPDDTETMNAIEQLLRIARRLVQE